MPPPSLSTSRTCNTSRHLSWIPWKTPASSPSPDDLLSSPTSSATFQHDPLVTSDHPDLPASPVAPSPSDSASSAPQPDTALATSAESTLDTTAISLPPLDPNASLGELISNSGRSLEDILNSPEAIHAAVSIPDLSLIGLDHRWFSFPGYAVDALVGLHNATGLPWYAGQHSA